jgi:hypothetical protein
MRTEAMKLATPLWDSLQNEYGDDAYALAELGKLRLGCVSRGEDPAAEDELRRFWAECGGTWVVRPSNGKWLFVSGHPGAWFNGCMALAIALDERWTDIPVCTADVPIAVLTVAREKGLSYFFRTKEGIEEVGELFDQYGTDRIDHYGYVASSFGEWVEAQRNDFEVWG